ncbi:zinc-binding dehydrogenase [Streptomyces sp. NPDC001537]
MKFSAAVWDHADGVRVEEVELLERHPRDVLVRIEASNVASSEASAMLGPAPAADLPPDLPPGLALPPLPLHIPGHSAVGVVEEVGPSAEGVKVGDRVLMTGNNNCGVCHFCQRGRYDQCAAMVLFGPATARTANGVDVHPLGYVGSLAEWAVVLDNLLVPVRTDLPADQLSLIGNPVCTGVGAALRTARIEPGSVVAVVGCGPVGLSYIQAARLALADQIIAIEPLAHRREAALRMGATTVIDPAETDPVEAVCELSGDAGGVNQGRGADYVFDAANDASATEQAWAMTRTAGDLTLAGLDSRPGARVSFPMVQFSNFGKTIHSCQMGSLLMRRDLPWMVRLAERGQLDLASLAERTYPLKAVGEALRDLAECNVLGATVDPRL